MSRRPARRKKKGSVKNRRRSGSSNLGPILTIIGSVALIGAALGFAGVMMSGEDYDEMTLCLGSEADHVSVFLLDLTDPLSPTQASRLKTMLNREIDQSEVDTMMSFGVVSEDPKEWGSRFARCKPRTGEAASTLYENPRQIAERYRDEFRQPLESTLSAMILASEADRSPIMEAMQALVAETPYFTSSVGKRKIIIVSDMLQHSDTLSAYRGEGWEHFQQTRGSDRLAGNLSDVDVKIIQIPRLTNADTQLSEDFWVRYFDKQGSNLPEIAVLGDL